jgi:hypothetical protein
MWPHQHFQILGRTPCLFGLVEARSTITERGQQQSATTAAIPAFWRERSISQDRLIVGAATLLDLPNRRASTSLQISNPIADWVNLLPAAETWPATWKYPPLSPVRSRDPTSRETQ